MWYTSGKHRALKSLWCTRAAKRNHYWKREERGDLNNWTCFLESAIEKLNSEIFKNLLFALIWISGGWVEIWTIRHGSWWSFEEERVEGEQKNKILNDEITMQSIAGISKWHKESLKAEKMWKQLCEVTLSYQMDQRSWNEIHANTIQFEGVDSLLWIIKLQLQLKCWWMCQIRKKGISLLFLGNRNWGGG